MKTRYLFPLILIIIIIGSLYYKSDRQINNSDTKIKNIAEGPVDSKGNHTSIKGKPANARILEGYLQDFRDPNVADYSKLTHVVFSFIHPTTDGQTLFGSPSALKNLRTVVSKAKKYHTKVIAAVGGWSNIQGGPSYGYFKAAISNPASRMKLANELSGLTEREDLDGIDIDFEYPRSPADSKNLAAFAKELSGLLHPKGKELSVAVYAEVNAATGTESPFIKYDPGMFTYVDRVNIMAYDGQWDGKYNAANLSSYPFTEKVVKYWSHFFDENHLAKDKLVLGVPLYAQPDNPAVRQVSYAAIVGKNAANDKNDHVNLNGTTYYYNGEDTMKMKTVLALGSGFGGMMMWEEGQDARGAGSITNVIAKSIAEWTHNYAKKDK